MIAKTTPWAQAKAVSCWECVRPLAAQIYVLRRRIATITVTVLAGLLFVHVMFGANGMIVYKQKRMDYKSLQKRLLQEQKENELYTQRIQGLKTDEKAIEKEAREQLHYVRPGNMCMSRRPRRIRPRPAITRRKSSSCPPKIPQWTLWKCVTFKELVCVIVRGVSR